MNDHTETNYSDKQQFRNIGNIQTGETVKNFGLLLFPLIKTKQNLLQLSPGAIKSAELYTDVVKESLTRTKQLLLACWTHIYIHTGNELAWIHF